MATITKKALPSEAQFGGTPYGNATKLQFNLTTNAVGAAVNSDTATGIGLGDVVRIGILPAGAKLFDALAIVSTNFTAAVTAKVGFLYVDGVDSTAVPQNDAYFFTAGAVLTTAAALRSNAPTAPLTLPKDAYLVITTAGAANAKAAVLDVIVDAILTGAP